MIWLRSGRRYRGRLVQKLRDGRFWCAPVAVRDGRRWKPLGVSMRMYVEPRQVVSTASRKPGQ